MHFSHKIFTSYFATATMFIILHPLTVVVTQRVALNSTVSTKGVAYSGQVIVFTCVTRGSLILEWYSDEYIGTGGHRLQLLSVNCVGANVTGATEGTSATCLRVTEEGSETVIVSQLLVRASVQIPASTVTCTNNGHGSSKAVTFETAALPNEEVTLNTTLTEGVAAHPQQKLIFTCITRGSLILEWFSDEYIGRNGDRLQLLSVNCVGANITSDNSDAAATCLSVFNVNGTVIVSELHVTASLQYPQSTVSCTNNGLGSRRMYSFQTASVTSVEDEHDEASTSPDTSTTEDRLRLTTSTVAVSVQSADSNVDMDSKLLGIVLAITLVAIMFTVVVVIAMIILLYYRRRQASKKNMKAQDYPVDNEETHSGPVTRTTAKNVIQDTPIDNEEELKDSSVDIDSEENCSEPVASTTEINISSGSVAPTTEKSEPQASQKTPENSDDELSVTSSTPLTKSRTRESCVDGKKNHNMRSGCLSPPSKTMTTWPDTSQVRAETKEPKDPG